MAADGEPLILSAKASRRLRLLQLPALAPPAAAASTAAAAPLVAADGSLPVALLAEPIPACSSIGGSWQQERDVLLEVGVTLPTLQALQVRGPPFWVPPAAAAMPGCPPARHCSSQPSRHSCPAMQLPSGAVVLVSNARRPGAAPHLARLLALPEGAAAAAEAAAAGADAADGVAYLAPSLAYNLGLAPHLWPLLHPTTGPAASGSSGSSSGASSGGASRGPAAGPDRVSIWRYRPPGAPEAGQQGQQGQQHGVAQPGVEPAVVPVATEAHIALVRCPAAAVLQQRAKQPGEQPHEHQRGSQTDGSEVPSEAELASSSAGAAAPAAAAAEGAGSGTAAEGTTDDAVAALQQWFVQAPRVVCPGDVLAVPRLPPGGGTSARLLPQLQPSLHAAQPPPAGTEAASGATAAPLELLHFKVTKLVLPPALETAAAAAAAAGRPPCRAAAVDVSSTAVKLAGRCSSGLPVGLPHYLAAAPAALAGQAGGSSSSSSSGGGSSARLPVLGAHAAAAAAATPLLPAVGPLLQPWRELAQLLASVLHPAAVGVPLRLAVLLHGPSGCGKRTAVAAAAAAVGCHLVSLSSHDVKAAAGAAERHTFEGLRAAFGAAAEYAPAVLLLRQFSVLGDASSHGGSASASSHSYAARLGSVLAECIRAHDSSRAGSGNSSHGGGNGGSGASAGQQQGQEGPACFPAPVVLVACTASADDLPPALRRCFTHEIALEAPDQQQRQALLQGSLAGVAAEPAWVEEAAGNGTQAAGPAAEAAAASKQQAAALQSGCLEDTARHTAGLLPRELRAVAADAAAAAAVEALPPAAVLQAAAGGSATGPQANGSSRQPGAAAPPLLSEQHLAAAVEGVRQRTATDIGAKLAPCTDPGTRRSSFRRPACLCHCLPARLLSACMPQPPLAAGPCPPTRRSQDPQCAVGGRGRAGGSEAGHPGHRWGEGCGWAGWLCSFAPSASHCGAAPGP